MELSSNQKLVHLSKVQTSGTHSLLGKSWRYPSHGEATPRFLSYISAIARPRKPLRLPSSISDEIPEVRMVRQENGRFSEVRLGGGEKREIW